MTQRLNPNIAIALDMELPDEAPIEDSAPMVVVEPHEIITIGNVDLPDMSDIEMRNIQGEKQLEQIISKGMGMFTELYDELGGIDPKYRNRHLETTALIMGHTLDAIKHKTGHQLKRKKQRMEEAGFGKPEKGTKIGTANFFGSREELMKVINGATEVESPPESESE
jgi:hypothetical protein